MPETAVEYKPLSPLEIEELRAKELRGELSLEDCKRFIETTRAGFLSRPDRVSKAAPKAPPQESVDFF